MNRTSTHFFSGLAVAAVALATACSDTAGPKSQVTVGDFTPSYAVQTASAFAVGNNSGGGTTLSLARPAGTASGDFLIAQVTFEKGSDPSVVLTASGWTLVLRTNNGTDMGQAIWRRVAGAEAGPYVFGFGVSVKAAGGITKYTNVDLDHPSGPIAASSGSVGASGNLIAPSVSSTDSSKLVTFFAVAKNTTLTIPAGMTAVYEATASAYRLRANDETRAASGATNTRTSTPGSGDKWVAQSVILRGVSLPGKPTNLAAAIVSPTSNNITWTDNSANETGYTVTRVTSACGVQSSLALNPVGVNATGTTDTGLDPDFGYRYRVVACNGYGCSQVDSTNNVISSTTPDAPASLSGTYSAVTGVTLSWPDVANEAGYRIAKRTMVGGVYGPWEDIVKAKNATSHVDNTASADTRYQYRMKACSGAGGSAFTATATIWTGDPAPGAPTSIGASAISSTETQVTWSDNSATEDNFEVQRSTRTAGAWGAWETAGTPTEDAISFNDTGRTANTKYRYRVRACNGGGCSFYTAPPAIVTTPN